MSVGIIYIKDPLLGGYTVWFESLPNIIAEGETKEQAKCNLFKALHDVCVYLFDKYL